MSTSPSKSRAKRGGAAHLKLEKPHFLFLFLEGSGSATLAPADASVAPVGASTDDPVAGASMPDTATSSTAASAARGDGGWGFHLSGGASLSSSFSDDEFTGGSGGESPYRSRNRYSSLYCSRHSRRLSRLSFTRAARSCSRHCTVRGADQTRSVGGSERAACTITLC
jgi:hypothetical protein